MAEPETPPFDRIDEHEAPDPQPEAAPDPSVEQASAPEPFSIDSIDLPSISGAQPDPAPAPTAPQPAEDLFSIDLLNALAPADSPVASPAEESTADGGKAASAAALMEFEPVAADSPGEPIAEPAETQSTVRQGVRIGSLRLLLDFASTSQLSVPVPITPLPAMPHGLRGLASLHGNVLPVFDLASMLGITRSPTDGAMQQREMLLVVGHGDSAAAVLIDGLPDRFHLSDSDRSEHPQPADWLADCVPSGYAAGGETWLDIDHQCLLDKLEASLRAPRR